MAKVTAHKLRHSDCCREGCSAAATHVLRVDGVSGPVLCDDHIWSSVRRRQAEWDAAEVAPTVRTGEEGGRG